MSLGVLLDVNMSDTQVSEQHDVVHQSSDSGEMFEHGQREPSDTECHSILL